MATVLGTVGMHATSKVKSDVSCTLGPHRSMRATMKSLVKSKDGHSLSTFLYNANCSRPAHKYSMISTQIGVSVDDPRELRRNFVWHSIEPLQFLKVQTGLNHR